MQLAVSLTRPLRVLSLLSAQAVSKVPTLQVGLSTPLTAFVPRPAVTEQLRHALGSCSDEKRCPLPAPSTAPHHLCCHVAVLHGTGGVGKTQLALYHARQQEAGRSPYSLVWWVAAEQRGSLQLQYRKLATKANVSVDASSDFASLVSAVNAWLSGQHDWLLVLDNVRSFSDVEKIMPPTEHPSQHVIITTRHTHWPPAYRTVPVDVMEAAEAVELLKAAAAIPGSDATQDADIALLVSDLGRLPLALSHAGAYIQQLVITVKAYRQEYADSLLDSQVTMPISDPYQQAVASTWSISIAAVEAKAAAAGIPPLLPRLLLTGCAYLDPDGIPRSLLHRWLESALQVKAASSVSSFTPLLLWLLTLPRALWRFTTASTSPPAASVMPRVDSAALDALLALLHSFSLISFTAADNPSIRMHRVLGTVLRHQQVHSAPENSGSVFVPFDLSWCETMVETVIEEYEQSAELPALRDVRLLSQMQSLRQALDRHGSACGWLDSLARAELLSQVGDVLLFRLSEYAKAKVELEAALAIFEAHHGSEHVRVALVLNHLGGACIRLGDYSRARELLERSLRIMEANYDANDVQLAPTLGNLGIAHHELGEHAKAKELLERSLAINEAHLGPDHVQVAVCLSGLASVYGSLGDHSRKRELLERVLATEEALYGSEHVEVAATINNLGATYNALGEPAKARDTLQRALDILQAHYGDHHIALAAALNNLGSAYGALGEQQKRRELLERALAIEERYYGSEHVELAITLNSLGRAYGVLGDHAKAKAVLERALRLMETHYGQQQHESLAMVLSNLSREHAALGDADTAGAFRERARVIRAAAARS